MDLKTIAANQLKPLIAGQPAINLGELWKNDTCVLVFFRRWGCMFCRLWAKEVSEIAPILKKHDIKLIGIGVEDLGAEEFKDGKFFDGELYTAATKDTYNFLGFKRSSFLSVMASLLWKESRDAIWKSRHLGIDGNLKGDALQYGGALIVGKGGSLLSHFVQNGPAQHMSNAAILKALGLEDELKTLPNEENSDIVTSEGESKK